MITVTSSAFADGEPIPARFSCDGAGVSPPLAWQGVPPDAQAVALVVDDPDAPRGTFVHWVVLDIDPSVTSVDEAGVPGNVQARNSAGDPTYFGPCPPKGTHHYRFTVYALSAATGLTPGAKLDEALKAIDKAATAQGRLVGTYTRGG
jgi:Raf kinase inhibitor-like YbhB/YbcL family protein